MVPVQAELQEMVTVVEEPETQEAQPAQPETVLLWPVLQVVIRVLQERVETDGLNVTTQAEPAEARPFRILMSQAVKLTPAMESENPNW